MKMKDFGSRLTAGIACAALVFGLTLPANAAAPAEAVRVGSYKGDSLDVGERSGLIIGLVRSMGLDPDQLAALIHNAQPGAPVGEGDSSHENV